MRDTSDSKLDNEITERHESHTVDTGIRSNLRTVAHARTHTHTHTTTHTFVQQH